MGKLVFVIFESANRSLLESARMSCSSILEYSTDDFDDDARMSILPLEMRLNEVFVCNSCEGIDGRGDGTQST